jgi:hypothetical protein
MVKEEQALYYHDASERILKEQPGISGKELDEQARAEAEKKQLAYEEDKWFYRILIILLAGVVLTVVIGSFVIIATGHDTTDGIIAIGSAAVGALVGIFATTNK